MIDIKSLYFGKFDRKKNIFQGNEMTPGIKIDLSRFTQDELRTWEVQPWQEMRIDLVINSIYGEDETSMSSVDVILAINQIDNPLNIKAGMVLIFPPLDKVDELRYQETNFNSETVQSGEFLGKPNKNTKVDPKRKSFIQNGYVLPPTVNKVPINPVRIQEGSFLVGGVK
jgi:hypothetical protein